MKIIVPIPNLVTTNLGKTHVSMKHSPAFKDFSDWIYFRYRNEGFAGTIELVHLLTERDEIFLTHHKNIEKDQAFAEPIAYSECYSLLSGTVTLDYLDQVISYEVNSTEYMKKVSWDFFEDDRNYKIIVR